MTPGKLTHPQAVFDIPHTRHHFSDVFCTPLCAAVVYVAGKRYFSVGYRDINVGSVDKRIVAQAVVNIFLDALVGTGVIAGPFSAVLPSYISVALSSPFGIFVTKP